MIGTVRNVGYKFVKPAEPLGLRKRGGSSVEAEELAEDPGFARAMADEESVAL